MFVYARQSLIDQDVIHDVLKSSVATGLMDMFGNKGSVGISMRVYETRLCFVCSHFAADTDKLEKRNSDYRATKLKLKFQDDSKLNNQSLDSNDQQQQLQPIEYDLDDHDVIFWFGDLNYRCERLSLSDCVKHIYANNLDYLLNYDQLGGEIVSKRVFEDYQEGKIKFKPTYKFIIKTDRYEKQDLVDSNDPYLSQGKILFFFI